MSRITRWFPALVFVVVAGCSDGTLAPRVAPRVGGLLADAAGTPGCPGAAAAAVTVSDDAGLRAALKAAVPGELIAVSGMIGVTVDDTIATDGVALTCATPGSGLTAVGAGVVGDMVTVLAKGVTVDRLVLDGSATFDGPYLALNDGVTGFATDAHLTNSQITCGPGTCVFIVGAPRTVITGNHITAAAPFTGVHFQANSVTPPISNPPDDSRVEGNTLVATSPSQPSPFGAIRVTTASRVVLAHNVIQGPWANGMVLTQLAAGTIVQNDVENPLVFGIRLSRGFNLLFVTNSAFTNNSVTGAPSGGVFAFEACDNSFLANTLEGNGGDVGLIFPPRSGGNVVVGVDNATVIDNGAFDCDNDGDIDPNVIKGQGALKQAFDPSDGASDPVRQVHGIKLQ